MNPALAHITLLAREVQKKLAGTEATPESVQMAIQDVCPNECPRTRDRIIDQVHRNLELDDRGIESGTKRAPKPRRVASSRKREGVRFVK